MKEIKKLLIIDCCWDCPHRDKWGDIMYCRLAKKKFKSWLKRRLPRWCPLPTWKEEVK